LPLSQGGKGKKRGRKCLNVTGNNARKKKKKEGKKGEQGHFSFRMFQIHPSILQRGGTLLKGLMFRYQVSNNRFWKKKKEKEKKNRIKV